MEESLSFEIAEMGESHAKSESIRKLTSRMANGDESAWRTFFSQYAHRLRSYLTTCLQGQPSNLDDIFQDCMIRVSRHIKVFPSEEAFWSWLTVIARSALADQARRKSAWSRFIERYSGFTKLFPHRGAPDSSQLDRALESLSAEERALLEDKYENGDTVRQIALKADCSEKAIEHRLARTRAKLAKELKKNHPAP